MTDHDRERLEEFLAKPPDPRECVCRKCGVAIAATGDALCCRCRYGRAILEDYDETPAEDLVERFGGHVGRRLCDANRMLDPL